MPEKQTNNQFYWMELRTFGSFCLIWLNGDSVHWQEHVIPFLWNIMNEFAFPQLTPLFPIFGETICLRSDNIRLNLCMDFDEITLWLLCTYFWASQFKSEWVIGIQLVKLINGFSWKHWNACFYLKNRRFHLKYVWIAPITLWKNLNMSRSVIIVQKS